MLTLIRMWTKKERPGNRASKKKPSRQERIETKDTLCGCPVTTTVHRCIRRRPAAAAAAAKCIHMKVVQSFATPRNGKPRKRRGVEKRKAKRNHSLGPNQWYLPASGRVQKRNAAQGASPRNRIAGRYPVAFVEPNSLAWIWSQSAFHAMPCHASWMVDQTAQPMTVQ